MEYDSASSCDERLRDLESSNDNKRESKDKFITKARDINSDISSSWRPLEDLTHQPKVAFNVNKSLSKQVMEYYKKYSQNSNLDQYFSLPESNCGGENQQVEYYYSIYELNHRENNNRQDCVGQDYNLGNYVPRERRRWARPPLIGQSSNAADNSPIYNRPLTEPRSPSPEAKINTPDTITEDKNESRETIGGDIPERKSNASPTSSVTSHKPLEWDSGADVGYFNTLPQNKLNNKKLSTIERMALAGGCSAALRQDPEGTTESNLSNKVSQSQRGGKSKRKPDANSTPLPGNISESESEIEITPIVKNHTPETISGDNIRSEDEKRSLADSETPKSLPVFKIPNVKYATEGKKNHSNTSVLKKSSSMNILATLSSKLLLKRSQSDLNLRGKDKCSRVAAATLPLIFDSTSSLATVVNKPTTCDKVIQTTINERFQESIGVQVSYLDEEKPPVPKRGTSLAQKSIQSILKSSKNTHKLQESRKHEDSEAVNQDFGNGTRPSSTDVSYNESRASTPHLEDTENVTGRANSFEYFPGHVYENVPNGSESHVSSVDTRRSNSTMPNTSSSIDEKLWGDSDSLVRDLERSVNILKSLVDANKCDKQVKKRLIHHVVKRLVTAKYTDDKIEHNLEENVPWNPDDARKKVYRTDIIQALTKKQNTTDSSEEWKPIKKKKGVSAKKQVNEEPRILDEMITLESSNSDKFDVNTDRTEMDGRKARMGLRADDCQRSSNSPTDINKSGESSECFLPQRRDKSKTRDNIFRYNKRNPDIQNADTSTSDNPLDENRIYLDSAVDNRQSIIESSNGTRNSTDWRMPTTLSEKQFELRRRSTSESGDSKLVSYAETEKKNQLLWITNEISHLSNLKKLLEQPKKLDRPRMSPKKVKHSIVKQKPNALLKCACVSHNQDISEDVRRNGSDVCEDSLNHQWSSHCNLATCQSTVDDSSAKNISHTKKRNSCTQTGTENIRAHSQTGGEIISTTGLVKNRNRETKFANICVQTSPIPWEISSRDILQGIDCPVHKNYSSIQRCKCLGQICQCKRREEQQRQFEIAKNLTKSNRNCICNLSRNEKSSDLYHRRSPSLSNYEKIIISHNGELISDESGKEKKKSEAKETKNKVNETKSIMCGCNCNLIKVCQCVGNCSCEFNFANKKGSSSSNRCEKLNAQICKLCLKKIQQIDISEIICNCGQCKEEKFCECNNYCTCENINTKKDGKLCSCSAGCRCENKKMDNEMIGDNICCKIKWSEKKMCECLKNDCDCKNKEFDKLLEKEKEEEKKKTCNCYNKDRKLKYSDCLRCLKKKKEEDDEMKRQMKPYYLSKNTQEIQKVLQQSSRSTNDNENGVCKCGKDCCCENKLRDIERRLYSPKRGSARTNCSCESRVAIESNGSNNHQQYCRTCGSMYNKNGRKCNCRINYPKPIAYELSFEENKLLQNSDTSINRNGKIDLLKFNDLQSSAVTNATTSTNKSGSCLCNDNKSHGSSRSSARSKTLREYLAQNKPDFLNNAETRQQCMIEISHLRELRREKRVQLFAMASGSNLTKTPRASKPKVLPAQRKISDEEMKERLRKRYYKLHEVRNKRQQREKQEQARHNKLMANIFCKKLQQKVLKGQVDLSNSVSVISNL